MSINLENNSLKLVGDEIIEEIKKILELNFNTQILINSVKQLSEPSRRNLILRIDTKNLSNGNYKNIIFKQSLSEEHDLNENDRLSRFARDWAGLEFLNTMDKSINIIPKFYGGSLINQFMLMEDLGINNTSLVDYLMGDNVQDANNTLLLFMTTLAKFHASSRDKIFKYTQILNRINSHAYLGSNDVNKMQSKIVKVLNKFNIELTQDLGLEINNIFKIVKESSPFTKLLHGDICPDNVIFNDDQNKMYIIDFEWSFVGNALLDGVYLRMCMPSCWCAKAFPEDVIRISELAYRNELVRSIPQANDDNIYYESYVASCAYWMLQVIIDLKDMLNSNFDISNDLIPHPKWKPEYNLRRPRNLYRLQAFIKVANEHNLFPHLSSMTSQILCELNMRWPDTEPLDQYPVYNDHCWR